jgi:hypothetical protein
VPAPSAFASEQKRYNVNGEKMSKTKTPLKINDTPLTLPDEKPATAEELVAAIHKTGLIGMWKNRTDIQNSEEFARELRKRVS